MERGNLFVCGYGKWGEECGCPNNAYDNISRICKPTPLSLNNVSKITKVECGSFHLLVALENNSVLALDKSEQLSEIPDETHEKLEIRKIDRVSARNIAAGRNFSLIVSTDSEGYSWGEPIHGKLGLGSQSCTGEQMNPRPIKFSPISKDFRQIAAGDDHCVALAGDGGVWAWGSNAGGRLGVGPETSFLSAAFEIDESKSRVIYSPIQIKSLSSVQIEIVCCGAYHSLALDQYGDVFGWGSNQYGQVGNGSQCKTVTSPKRLSGIDGPVVRVDGGSFHSLAVVQSGMVFSWGLNSHGQLGIEAGRETCKFEPEIVTALIEHRIIQVAAGAFHSVALGLDGSLFSFGHGMYGQLGHGDCKSSFTPRKIDDIPSVAHVSCGNWFTAFVSGDPSSLVRYAKTKPLAREETQTDEFDKEEQYSFLASLFSYLPVCNGIDF